MPLDRQTRQPAPPTAVPASVPPTVALADTVRDLYTSLLSTHEHARDQLQAMQDIERRHHRAPLDSLVGLAADTRPSSVRLPC